MKKILVTGVGGLIGSEVVGLDNNMRADLFGEKGDTTWNLQS